MSVRTLGVAYCAGCDTFYDDNACDCPEAEQ